MLSREINKVLFKNIRDRKFDSSQAVLLKVPDT